MELIFNELSLYPLAANNEAFEVRLNIFLNTFKESRKEFNFTHIRFPQNYSQLNATNASTLLDSIVSLKKRTLKVLALGLFKAPYTDDLELPEINELFETKYSLSDKDCPSKDEPFGLVVAYIKSKPTISFTSDTFWKKNRVNLVKHSNAKDEDDVTFSCFNIFIPECLKCKEIVEWSQSYLADSIQTDGDLIQFLNFSTYTITFADNFVQELIEWKESDYRKFRYILMLMKDVEIHPFTGGMGKTENLAHRGKEASKRITQPDRLSYELKNNIVHFIACKGHYEHH